MYEIIKKEFFNKKILSSSSFISMVCFTMVLILVVVLGSAFGYVSADSGESLFFSQPDYVNSNVYDSTNYFQGYINMLNDTVSSNAILTSNTIMSHDWSTSFTGQNTADVDVSSFKYYMIVGNAYPSSWRIYFFDQEVYCFVGLGNVYSYTVVMSSSNANFWYCDITPWGNGTTVESPYAIFPDTLLHANGSWDYGFNSYTCPFTTSSSTTICATNMKLLTYKNGTNFTYGSYLNDLLNYSSGASDANVVNINYLYDSGECVPLTGLDNLENTENYGSGSSESSETSANNMYLRNSKWSFAFPSKWSNMMGYSGNATFTASLNDWQSENLNDFYLRFTFSIETTLSYVQSGDSGSSSGSHGSAVNGSTDYVTGYLNSIFSYKDSTTNQEYCDVPLQTFYNMGCSKSFMSLNGIFDRCFQKKLSLNDSSTNSTSFVSWYSTYGNNAQYTVSKAMLYCYATLYDQDGNSSGNCTYYYNLLTGESGIKDSSMNVNSNPLVDEDGNIVQDTGEDGSGGTSINNDNSNSGVNVTQTVNVNNDSSESKSWLWTLVTNLISGSDEEGLAQAGMSESLSSLAGINPWLSIMSSTLGFVPATVWTSLSVAFIAVLGIMVVAFVLRVLLDLL